MPYVFSKISKSLKDKEDKKEKGFTSVEGGAPAASLTPSVAGEGGSSVGVGNDKKESSDQPSMKQYIVQNKQDYDLSPVGEVYSAAKKRDLGEGSRIKTEEQQKYDKMVKSKEKPTWSAPTISYGDYSFQQWSKPEPTIRKTSSGITVVDEPEDVAPPSLADVSAPDPVNTAAYDAQVAGLENYINQIKMYAPNEEELVPTSTAQGLQMLGNKYGRQELLRREFADDTPNYTQGMLALDQALSEREGFDTRPMGQQYVQTKQQSDQLAGDILGTREQQVSERDTFAGQSAKEQDAVQAQKQQHLNAYQQAQQRFSAYQAEKQRRDAAISEFNARKAEQARQQAAKEKADNEASYKQQQEQSIADATANIESQRRANYDAYVQQQRASDQESNNAGLLIARAFAKQTWDREYNNYLALKNKYEQVKNSPLPTTYLPNQNAGVMRQGELSLLQAQMNKAIQKSNAAGEKYKSYTAPTKSRVVSYDEWARNNSNVPLSNGGAFGQIPVGEMPSDYDELVRRN